MIVILFLLSLIWLVTGIILYLNHSIIGLVLLLSWVTLSFSGFTVMYVLSGDKK